MNKKYPRQVLINIEKYFEKEREHLKKRLSQIEEADPFNDPDHANDNADIGVDIREEMAHQQSQANRGQVVRRLEEIDEVLVRIDNGSYGFCKSCKRMIDTDRLSTNPLVTLCIDCAKK